MAAQKPSPNPSTDAVLEILTKEMRTGSPLPISDQGVRVLRAYRKSFEQRLQDPANWQREGAAVRQAARQLGVISSAIASLRRETQVTEAAVLAAATVVEGNCTVGHEGFGRWCSREP